MSGVCFVDTETTGLHADRHEIWEVGLILPDGTERDWLLTVARLADADPIGLSIGRFHERHPQGNRPSRDVITGGDTNPAAFAREFARLTHECHLAGAVVSFDEERLRRLLWRHGVQPSWHYHLVDVEALAAGWIAHGHLGLGPAMHKPPWDSTDLSRAVGVDPGDFDRHTALGDCRWAKAIYDKVMGT